MYPLAIPLNKFSHYAAPTYRVRVRVTILSKSRGSKDKFTRKSAKTGGTGALDYGKTSGKRKLNEKKRGGTRI